METDVSDILRLRVCLFGNRSFVRPSHFSAIVAAPTSLAKNNVKKRSVAKMKIHVMTINSVKESSKWELSSGSNFTTTKSENTAADY